MQTVWLSPTDYVTGDRSLQISYPSVSHPSTIVTSKKTGDFKWISMGLNLPENITIEELIICYQVSNARSFISEVRLSEMATPDQALVRYVDPTDLQSTTPVRYSSIVGGIVRTPGNAVTLELKLNFRNTADKISFGAVGVVIREISPISPVGAVSVKTFGAVGNGVADDTAAINAAVAGAVSSGCRHIYFPPGTYKVQATAEMIAQGVDGYDEACILIPSNFKVSGEGGASIIRWASDSWGGSREHYTEAYYMCFRCQDNTSNVVFEGLHFIGNNNPFVHVQNAQSVCIDLWQQNWDPLTNIYQSLSHDITVRDCLFEDMWGFSIHGRGEDERICVLGCTTLNCANGINVNSKWGVFSHNRIYNSEGFECGGRGVVISNNTIVNALIVAISCGGSTAENAENPGSIVIGNVIDGCVVDANGAGGIGIVLADASSYSICANNTVRHCENGGILVKAEAGPYITRGVMITGNQVIDNCKPGKPNVSNVWGILVAGTGGHTITGNRCVDTGEADWRQQIGIVVHSSNNFISGNFLSGTNQDILIDYGIVNTRLGNNHYVNQKVQIIASETPIPELRVGLLATDTVEHSRSNAEPAGITRFARTADGTLRWSDGTRYGLDVWDTNLYRSGTNTLKTDDEFVSAVGFTIGSQRIKNGTDWPKAGTWSVGDIVYNTTPIAGGFIGWVCIVSGTPGTWNAFGPIEVV